MRALLLTPDDDCAAAITTLATHSRWVRIDLDCVDTTPLLRTVIACRDYDVILVDALITPDGVDGLLAAARRQDCVPPVILLKSSGFGDVEDRRRGAAECLAKTALSTPALEYAILCVLQRRQTQLVLNVAEQTRAALQTREVEVEALKSQLCQVQKSDGLGRVAGAIVHDFNNVLASIDGYVELLRSSFDLEDERRADLEEIRRAAMSGLDLTRQLLSYVRRQAPTPSLTDVNAAVGAVTKMVRRLMPARIELLTRCDPTLAGAGINRGKCEQVLLNLVLNARDAIATDGRIVIETSNVTEDDRRCIKLSVTDTGSGMDDATQARLFEPFFTTKGDEGTGLGLAVVQSIVSEAGGQVAVSSALGRGTTFTVLLPSGDEPCSHQATDEDVSMLRGSETILLVEDNGDLRHAYARVLRNHGYTVYEARDGSEALQVQNENQLELDLLITDLDMPRLGGRELANALRLIQPSLRTLFTSGHRAPDVQDLDGAAADFLEKPFTGERLLRGVNNLLQRYDEPVPPVRTPTVHRTH